MADPVKYEVGVWYGWNGGERPVHPETVVDFMWTLPHRVVSASGLAKLVFWDDDYCKVIAFRIIKEYKEPREFWLDPVQGYRPVSDAYSGMPGIIHVREVIE